MDAFAERHAQDEDTCVEELGSFLGAKHGDVVGAVGWRFQVCEKFKCFGCGLFSLGFQGFFYLVILVLWGSKTLISLGKGLLIPAPSPGFKCW